MARKTKCANTERIVRRAILRCATATLLVSLLLSTGCEAGAFAAGDANEAQCSGSTESSPGFRTYLPDCRAYELATPPFKNGAVPLYEAPEPAAISSEGTRIITMAGGAFAGVGNDWFQGNRNPAFDAYELTRTATGWEPTALTPPATQYPHSTMMAASVGGLETTLWGVATTELLFHEDLSLRTRNGVFEFVGPGVAPERAAEENESGEELEFAGASHDLTHSVFWIQSSAPPVREAHNGHGDLWPGDTTGPGGTSLYEYAYAGAPHPEPTLVGVSNEGALNSNIEAHLISSCRTELGSMFGGSAYNAVSEDGDAVFFTADTCIGAPKVNELYARLNGEKTVSISEPSKLDCEACDTSTELKNATFQGASRNGEKVFFLTEEGLVRGQEGVNLYEYDFGRPAASAEHPDGKIVLVSGDTANPEVQGVVRVSESGERVYFVAKGKLALANTEGDEPEEGADNLYVYEPDRAHPSAYHTAFVAKLLTPAEEAGIQGAERVEEARINEEAKENETAQVQEAKHRLEYGEISPTEFSERQEAAREASRGFVHATVGTRGPSGTLSEDHSVWAVSDDRPAQANADGEYLLFVSSANLTADDQSRMVPQLFEYDASTEELSRVSIGQGGTYNSDGDVGTFRDSPQIPIQSFTVDSPTATQIRSALSEDGSDVYFTSADSLTPQAQSGDTNVYEHRGGNVYLISGGEDGSSYENASTVQLFGSDPTGQDVLFTSAESLVPQDGESQMVLYDARDEGGFSAPSPAPGCSGETCYGATGTTPQLQSPGSAGQAGGGNLSPTGESKPAAKPRPKPLPRAQKLARALKACGAKRTKKMRSACEAEARRAYGAKARFGKRAKRTK